ncbi:hypothetical protein [Moorena sp. SIO3A5]|uniref:hypothetical protein n=1 Tax=Moorena sp. SIO3A5 TaxID=2607822 RepID=UPI00141C88CE|nr:hypothetical protein [Moorena sp. SIO3A5]NEP70320.1 ATP-binding protein [Moorena sp. SIO3A5]
MGGKWVAMPLKITSKLLDYGLWFSCRLLIVTPRVVIWMWKSLSRLSLDLSVMASKSYDKLITVYDRLPYDGGFDDIVLVSVDEHDGNVVGLPVDLLTEIQSKQLMIIGATGSGKSTLAQWLSYQVGGQVIVYECEGSPDSWRGLQVVGQAEDFDSINQSMAADLKDLTHQIEIRAERGDSALAGSDRVLIAEEFPELVQKCSNASEWLERHARRGRKARRFLILLSQYDQVAAWGLEGKSGIAANFLKLRLGKLAVKHAGKLKDDQLVEWVKSDSTHALLDDDPVTIPSYRELTQVTRQLPISTREIAETPGRTELNRISESSEDSQILGKALAELAQTKSPTYVIKNVLGYTGSRYQAGKAEFQKLIGGKE